MDSNIFLLFSPSLPRKCFAILLFDRTALMSCLLPSKCCCSEFCIQNFNFRTSAQELQCLFVKLWVRHLCVGNACWTFNFRAPGSKLVLPSLKSGHFASELLIMKFCLGPWRCIWCPNFCYKKAADVQRMHTAPE